MTISDKFIELVISGSSFFDVVLELDGIKEEGLNNRAEVSIQLGGVFNIARMLSTLNINFNLFTLVGSPVTQQNIQQIAQIEKFTWEQIECSFSEGDMCRAVITIDNVLSSRTSYVQPGVSKKYAPKTMPSSNFHHISYLDYLDCYDVALLKNLRQKCNFISADLCKNNPNLYEITTLINKLQYIDLLIISDSEFKAYFQNDENFLKISSDQKLGLNLVVHSPTYVDIYKEGSKMTQNGEFFENVNVLGMGDRFVAYFYSHYMKRDDIVSSSIMAYDSCQGDLKK
jgi:sugar/nucleoside kinase (ribokinase family)